MTALTPRESKILSTSFLQSELRFERIGLVISGLLVLGAFLFLHSSSDESSVGEIETVATSGDTMIRSRRAAFWRSARQGSQLEYHSFAVTGQKSSSVFRLADGSLIELGEDSLIEFVPSSGATTLILKRGSVRIRSIGAKGLQISDGLGRSLQKVVGEQVFEVFEDGAVVAAKLGPEIVVYSAPHIGEYIDEAGEFVSDSGDRSPLSLGGRTLLRSGSVRLEYLVDSAGAKRPVVLRPFFLIRGLRVDRGSEVPMLRWDHPDQSEFDVDVDGLLRTVSGSAIPLEELEGARSVRVRPRLPVDALWSPWFSLAELDKSDELFVSQLRALELREIRAKVFEGRWSGGTPPFTVNLISGGKTRFLRRTENESVSFELPQACDPCALQILDSNQLLIEKRFVVRGPTQGPVSSKLPQTEIMGDFIILPSEKGAE